MTRVVAAAGVFVLAVSAPFEAASPIVRLPGQSVSSVEAVVLLSLGAWVLSLAWARRLPQWRTPLALPWLSLAAAMGIAALAAPSLRTNAWHMAGRYAAAVAVYLLVVHGITNRDRLRTALVLSVASGVVVAALTILEYLQVGWVLRLLEQFRPSVTAVGAQVRAGGSLQYPTIASMYLEIVFAFGLGLTLYALDEGSRARAAMWFLSLLLVAEAITLTFTRAGLVTVAVALALAGFVRFGQRGFDTGVRVVAALAIAVVALVASSRSAQTLWLRLTSETQDAWYRADIDAPEQIAMSTNRAQYVTVTARNTGRVPWDSTDDPPIYLSYHWLQADADRVVAFEGERTAFDRPVPPGSEATVHALVRAPKHPGAYRLEWDLAQEGRLWFSTEPDAPPSAMSHAVVSGPALGGPEPTIARPRRAVRPGRLVLWRAAAQMVAAHPLLGVGPDNFRLLYGQYAGLTGADPRTHSNNMYLEVLVSGGIVAAAVFAWFLRDAFALFASICKRGRTRVGPRSDPGPTPIGTGIAAAGAAIALHGTVDSFLSFAPTYILFALTLGFAAAVARGMETSADAHRV